MAFSIRPDFTFLRGLLDIFPFASDDLEARSALWNIMERLLLQVQECEMPPSVLHGCVSVLAEKSDLIEDLLDHKLEGLKATSRHRAVSFLVSLHYLITLMLVTFFTVTIRSRSISLFPFTFATAQKNNQYFTSVDCLKGFSR